MRFRDDDYSTLSLFRTDIGEDPDTNAVTTGDLLKLCQTVGDSKATLKFLIVQTSVPGHSAASVIPPPPNGADIEATPYRSSGVPSLVTDSSIPGRSSSRHSKEGSMSSVSEIAERMGSDWSEIGPESEEWTNSGNMQIYRSRRNVKQQKRIERSDGSSRSPLTDRSGGAISPARGNPAPQRGSLSSNESPSHAWQVFDTPISPTAVANVTPTPNVIASSSSAGPTGLGLDMDNDMDPETRALIAKLQEEEMQEAEQARLRQLAEDELFAQREQAAERLLWERHEENQYNNRQQTRQQQVREDEIRAVGTE